MKTQKKLKNKKKRKNKRKHKECSYVFIYTETKNGLIPVSAKKRGVK